MMKELDFEDIIKMLTNENYTIDDIEEKDEEENTELTDEEVKIIHQIIQEYKEKHQKDSQN